jgi:uncharacterized pyridoxamine 5'-phosphate oxidase family protein
MHETEDDLRRLQELIDGSHARGGAHLRSIFDEARRLSAHDLSVLLRGVCVLALATVTERCEPRVAPVDGLFFRGHFWFGSSTDSARFRHIRRRPGVSASHTRGEDLAVVVHGRAVEIDVEAPEHATFRAYLLEVYPDWEEWWSETTPPYARIEPHALFTFASDRAKLLAQTDETAPDPHRAG